VSRGYCNAELYCAPCDSVARTGFMVDFLDADEAVAVGDSIADHVRRLWDDYAIREHPAGTELRLLEAATCRICGSGLWVELYVDDGRLAAVDAVPLSRTMLLRIHYATVTISDPFERATREPFYVDGRLRSDWPARFVSCVGVGAFRVGRPQLRWFADDTSGRVDYDPGGVLSSTIAAALAQDAIAGLGESPLDLGAVVVERAISGGVPDRILALRPVPEGDDVWVLRRQKPVTSWTFVAGAQLRALAMEAALLRGVAPPRHTVRDAPAVETQWTVVEEVSRTPSLVRHRALSTDGVYAIVSTDVRTGRAVVENEPAGTPLSAMWLPLEADDAIDLGQQLVAWTKRRGSALAVGLDGVYVEFEHTAAGSRATVTGVLTSDDEISYAAPSGPSDAFTIAALMAHVATGEHPFAGDDETSWRSANRAGKRRASWTVPALAAILDAGLDQHPARRVTLDALEGALVAWQRRT